MRRRRKDDSAGPANDEYDHLKTGRLTWLGLSVATIGWIGLIAGATIGDSVQAKLPRPMGSSFHSDAIDIAMCLIGSGFALAVIGALQSGFGALNRFFEAVLMRSAQRTTTPAQAEPEMTSSHGRRPYRILADGSVEVETIVGTRRFNSLDEAHDFI